MLFGERTHGDCVDLSLHDDSGVLATVQVDGVANLGLIHGQTRFVLIVFLNAAQHVSQSRTAQDKHGRIGMHNQPLISLEGEFGRFLASQCLRLYRLRRAFGCRSSCQIVLSDLAHYRLIIEEASLTA